VVPVYNSAGTLCRLVEEISTAMRNVTEDFEIILVNDGSKDGSANTSMELAKRHDFVIVVELSKNYGQHNALLCGIRKASKGVIVTLDDDLQNPPSEISKLLVKLNDGYDVVYGVPEKERHGFLRDLASLTTKLVLQKAMGADIATNISTFRAFRTELRAVFETYRSPYVCIDILLTWSTDRFAAVNVKHSVRETGTSNYTLGRLIRHAANLITGFSVLPLQLASLTGFILLFVGLLAAGYVIANYILHPGTGVPGFAFLACSILIFSAAQLLALGIIGEYLARMYAGTMGHPVYQVRHASNVNDSCLESSYKLGPFSRV
jgi:undecaprenyl-phosphate 4-deoxy-4-formamido-L-arabinose transferase